MEPNWTRKDSPGGWEEALSGLGVAPTWRFAGPGEAGLQARWIRQETSVPDFIATELPCAGCSARWQSRQDGASQWAVMAG